MTQLALATLRAAEMVRTLGGEGGNPVRALVAYFEPIMQDLNATVFDPHLFAARVRAAYGWNFSHEAAEGFRYTFRSLKLIEPCRDSMGNPQSDADGVPIDKITACRTTSTESRQEFESKVARIVAAFRSFVAEILSGTTYSRSDDQVIDNLLTWILDVSEESAAETDLENSIEEDATRDQDRYLVARFVSSTIRDGGPLVGDLETIYLVGLVADLADEFKTPSRKVEKTTLTVFLDSPVALDLLGTSGKDAAESTRAITNKLQAMGAKVELLHQTRQELINTMYAIVSSDIDKRTGPTGEALIAGEVDEAYLRSLISDPENALRPYHVRVRTRAIDDAAGQARFFAQSDYDELFAEYFSRYPPMTVPAVRIKYEKRCHHDTNAAKIIARLRGEDIHSDLFAAGSIFLTRNRGFAAIAKNFFVHKNLIDESCVGPFVTMHELAASLWLRTGMGAQTEMPRRQLLTNCARVLARNERVVGKARRAILSLRSDHASDPERVRQLEAILMQDRSMLMISDRVRGAMQNFDVEDIDAVVKEFAKVEQLKGFSLAQSEVVAEYEALRAENERLKNDNAGLASSLNDLTDQRRLSEATTNERLGVLESQMTDKATKDQGHFVRLIGQVNDEVMQRRKRYQIITILIVSVLILLATWKDVAIPLGFTKPTPTGELSALGWASVIASMVVGGVFLLGDLVLRTIGSNIRIDSLLFENWAYNRIYTLAEDHEVLSEHAAVELHFVMGRLERKDN